MPDSTSPFRVLECRHGPRTLALGQRAERAHVGCRNGRVYRFPITATGDSIGLTPLHREKPEDGPVQVRSMAFWDDHHVLVGRDEGVLAVIDPKTDAFDTVTLIEAPEMGAFTFMAPLSSDWLVIATDGGLDGVPRTLLIPRYRDRPPTHELSADPIEWHLGDGIACVVRFSPSATPGGDSGWLIVTDAGRVHFARSVDGLGRAPVQGKPEVALEWPRGDHPGYCSDYAVDKSRVDEGRVLTRVEYVEEQVARGLFLGAMDPHRTTASCSWDRATRPAGCAAP